MRRPKVRLPKELFISHSHEDRAFVIQLTNLLNRHHINYWYSPKHIVAAQQWHDEIGKALARCDWFLVVLSPHAVKSKWVGQEYLYALNDNRYARKIVPILHKKCKWKKLSWTLGNFQWVDFTKDFNAACQALLKAWHLPAAKPKAKKQSRR